MNDYDKILLAINERKSIEFEYLKIGKPNGKRFGNPHAMYIYSENTNNIAVDIFQTSGVSSNPFNLPSFRQFIVENIHNVEIIENNEKFEISKCYNPYSSKYNRPIALIK